jgi:hypothetical protein
MLRRTLTAPSKKDDITISPNSPLGSLPVVAQKKLMGEVYNQAKLEDPTLHDQTTLFFKAIQPNEKETFDSSTKTIIQFGISIGRYVTPLCKPSRPVIGYDHSNLAISTIEQKGIIGREINLNEIVNGGELSYYDLLAKDFSIPVDILVIRTLEALDPEAITLLMLAIIDLMKPSSKFYLEILSGKDVVIADKKTGITYNRNIQPGYAPSFFAPRTDIEFISHTISQNETPDQGSGETTVERFIAMKR